MEFAEVVRRRRMVRRYDAARAVDPAAVDRMLDHATRAPSAGFSQGWAFLRLDEPADVERFWKVTSREPDAGSGWLDGMRTAPVVLVPLSCEQAYRERYAEPDKQHSGQQFPIPYWHTDTAMAALLILQTAVDEGLGACFFGIPAERVDAFRAEFGVPETHTPVGAITVGHRLPEESGSAGSSARRRRTPWTSVTHRGRWNG